MFRIKICGVTNLGDALAAIDVGADALGFNFYRGSNRFVEREDTQELTRQLPGSLLKVGVFVNSDADEIRKTVEHARLDCVQLHGDESPEFLAEIPIAIPVIRAYRCGSEGLAPLASYLDNCRSLHRMPIAVLLDAAGAGDFGGTGQVADWSSIERDRFMLGDVPLILAGGLTPENVGDAIRAVRPDGVDVASGVERQAGVKDRSLIAKFVAAARVAFDRI